MCSDEGSYEWWHYCASGKRHPGVRCIDYWVSERQKYLDKDKDLAKYRDKDKDLIMLILLVLLPLQLPVRYEPAGHSTLEHSLHT